MIHEFESIIEFQLEWKNKTIEYAKSVNAFVEKGLKKGWDNAGPAPSNIEREHLVPYLLKAIKNANQTGKLRQLRSDWPLAHEPLVTLLEKTLLTSRWFC